jgi:hypothetical protein
MKSALAFLIVLLTSVSLEASDVGNTLLPTALNKILATVRIGTEREELIKRIKVDFPDSYFSEQVGGSATGGISIRLNERYELGTRVKSAANHKWIISENKFFLTDIQTKTCIIISIEDLKPYKDPKDAGTKN